ncbi:MAG: hypothetical protein HY670_08845 [Chloroflexi bacterium]|nr:hypothetical protein [Chloroflexota bacterium]
MLPEVKKYLEDVRAHLHLAPALERQIIGELYSYFQEKVAELQENGAPEIAAVREAIKSSGRPRVLARMMYEACNKGSLTEAFLSSLPHLVVAGLFVSHLWDRAIPSSFVFAAIVCVTLWAWWHGKPSWLYSWIGYSLLPLLIAGYASRPTIEQTVAFFLGRSEAFPDIRMFLLMIALFSLGLWTIVRTTMRVVRRDWVLASLMLVPLPILGSWLFNIEQMGGLLRSAGNAIYQWDTAMSLVLFMLAGASAVFIRLRRRTLKIIALITLGVIAGTMAGQILWGNPGFLGLLAAAFLMLLFLVGPALLEARIGHGELRGESWWAGEWLRRPSAIKID